MADNKLAVVLSTVGKYAGQVPELKSFLESNIAKAADVVGALAKVNSGQAFGEWKAQALAAVQAAGVKAHEEWQDLLLNLAWEAVKGESQRFFLLRWFVKVKDFLVRTGLNGFLIAAVKPAIAYFESQIAQPGASFQSVGESLFTYIKAAIPTNKDTWIALVVNIVKIAISAKANV